MNEALREGDERLPAVRARLFALVRSLWKAGVLQLPLALSPSERPALRLLHPLWQRLRVELLGETLLRDVLPPVERHLASAGSLERRDSGLHPDAPVDWPATWRRGLGRPGEAPLVTRRWGRELALPENLLAHRALREVAATARAALPESLSAQEAAPLHRLAERAAARLCQPPWSLLPGSDAATLPDEASQRIRAALGPRPAYGALLGWWQQWQGWRQPSSGPLPLLDPALEPTLLFELLFLFELVAALAARMPVRQARPLGGEAQRPAFVAQSVAGPLLLFYQSGRMLAGQRSLEALVGVPDLVLQLPGAPPRFVILDAKNFGPSGHSQALYKMLGYLYQFGYDAAGEHRFPQVLAGVLAFPSQEREGRGLRNWQRDGPGAQAVFSFVLPPLPDPHYHGLPDLIGWIEGHLKREA